MGRFAAVTQQITLSFKNPSTVLYPDLPFTTCVHPVSRLARFPVRVKARQIQNLWKLPTSFHANPLNFYYPSTILTSGSRTPGPCHSKPAPALGLCLPNLDDAACRASSWAAVKGWTWAKKRWLRWCYKQRLRPVIVRLLPLPGVVNSSFLTRLRFER
jgi:hypothetical protein